MNNYKVIFVGDSRKMKGGVSTVMKNLEKSTLWGKRECYWLETQINSANKWLKVLSLLRGFIKGIFMIPRYQIVHFQTAPGNSMKTLFPIFIFSMLCRKKIIVQLHTGNQIKKHVNDWLFKFWTTHTNCLIFLGKMWKEEIEPYLKKSIKTEFVYNPVDVQKKQDLCKKYFLFAAYFNVNKGIDVILEAFSIVVKNYNDWKLIMCGSGDTIKIIDFVNKHQLNDKIILPGWIEGKEKEFLFKNAYAYCMTSYEEGLPMSVLEAISYGVPLISTPVGCLPEVFNDNKTCLFFNFGDVNDLAKKMELLIKDYELRTELSNNSYKLCQEYFTIEAVANKLDNIYNSLTED